MQGQKQSKDMGADDVCKHLSQVLHLKLAPGSLQQGLDGMPLCHLVPKLLLSFPLQLLCLALSLCGNAACLGLCSFPCSPLLLYIKVGDVMWKCYRLGLMVQSTAVQVRGTGLP